MDTIKLSLQGAWELFYTGMLLGAGLPIVYALGVRLFAGRRATVGEVESSISPPGVLPRVLAGVCFAVVLLAAVTGILIIVAAGSGKEVSFENIYPTLVEKS